MGPTRTRCSSTALCHWDTSVPHAIDDFQLCSFSDAATCTFEAFKVETFFRRTNKEGLSQCVCRLSKFVDCRLSGALPRRRLRSCPDRSAWTVGFLARPRRTFQALRLHSTIFYQIFRPQVWICSHLCQLAAKQRKCPRSARYESASRLSTAGLALLFGNE